MQKYLANRQVIPFQLSGTHEIAEKKDFALLREKSK
ncbi:hypothetical protein [Brazilian marseillevirus]|nr:hypothetical protein A3303_gp027 [Brazilian marseillevirus]AMQ10535.1 hypothetical protein [Brazilian marseillevirus]